MAIAEQITASSSRIAQPQFSDWLTLNEASDYTKISKHTLRRRIAAGKLAAFRTGRLIRVRREDLDSLLVGVGGVL